MGKSSELISGHIKNKNKKRRVGNDGKGAGDGSPADHRTVLFARLPANSYSAVAFWSESSAQSRLQLQMKSSAGA